MTPHPPCPLSLIPPGQRVRVVTIAAGQRATRRLKDLGLVPGIELCVVQSQGHAALILAVGDSRLAVERGIALKVLVQPTAPDTALEPSHVTEHESDHEKRRFSDVPPPDCAGW